MTGTDPRGRHGHTRVGRRAALAVALFAMAGSVFAFGGVFTEAIAAAAVATLLALALALPLKQRTYVEPFGMLLLGLSAATALQLLPLPQGLVELLAPRTADIYRRAAEALGDPAPTRMPLSLDPPSTALMLAWMMAVTALYLVAHRLGERETDRTRLVLAVPVIGVLLLLVGLTHAVLGETRVYGIHAVPAGASPAVTGALFISSFINPNHLAAFMALGVPICISMAGASDLQGRSRVLLALGGVALLVGVALTGSRAGLLCALFTAGLAGLAVASRDRGRLHLVLLASAGVVFFVVLASPLADQLAALPGVSHLLEATDRGVRTVGLDTIRAWPLTGVGRGAFPVVQTALNAGVSSFTVTHAHNTPVQLLVDYGVLVGGVAILLGTALLLRGAMRSFASPLARGAALALLGLGLHNLVDFSLDILGVALSAAVLAAAVRSAPVRAGRGGVALPGRWVAATAVVMAVGLAVMTARVGPEPGPRRDARITEAPVDSARRHPADAYAFFAAGVTERSPALLEHARFLAPFEPRLPLALASLSRGDERFNRIRATLALPGAYRVRAQAFDLLQRSARTGRELVLGLPDGVHAAAYLAWQRPPSAAATAAVLAGFPESPEVLEHVAKTHLAAKNWAGLEEVATRLMALEAPSGYRMMAQVYHSRGKTYEAVQLFALAGDADSLLAAAELALGANDPRRALDVLEGARLPANALKRVRALESRARLALAGADQVDLKTRFDAERRQPMRSATALGADVRSSPPPPPPLDPPLGAQPAPEDAPDAAQNPSPEVP